MQHQDQKNLQYSFSEDLIKKLLLSDFAVNGIAFKFLVDFNTFKSFTKLRFSKIIFILDYFNITKIIVFGLIDVVKSVFETYDLIKIYDFGASYS